MNIKISALIGVPIVWFLLSANAGNIRCYQINGVTYCENGTNGGSGIRGFADEPPPIEKSGKLPVVQLTEKNPDEWLKMIKQVKAEGNAAGATSLQKEFDQNFPGPKKN